MKVTKTPKKNIADMTFKQLMEAFGSDDETSNIDGFDEFEDADAEGDDLDAEGDDLDAEGEADTEGETEDEGVTVTLPTHLVEALREIVSIIDGDTEEEDLDSEDEDLDADADEDTDEEEDLDSEDADDEDDFSEEEEEEEEEKDCEDAVSEDEETPATVTDGAPRKKVGTPAYSNKSTVDSVYTRGAKSGHGQAADVTDGAPRKKVGTPATAASKATVDSKINPGKSIFEV